MNSQWNPKIVKFDIMHKDTKLAHVEVDFLTQHVDLTKYIDVQPYQPFIESTITIDDVLDFLEERCFPKERQNCKELLDALNLSSYDVWQITEKTRGLMYDDYTWIKYEGDDVTYDEIKIRN